MASSLAALTTLVACTPSSAPILPDRPNVLLVTLDTTRADYLGSYGHAEDTSPALDRLAREGIRFERAISTSGLTPMAHASIHTGTNPYRHGLRVFYGSAGHWLADSKRTLASILTDQGWRTGAFVSAYSASQRYGLQHGFQTFDTGIDETLAQMNLSRQQRHNRFFHDGPTTNSQRRGDATTDAALAWLAADSSPFFMWVHYFDPHDLSLVPPNSFLQNYDIQRNSSDSARIAIYGPEIRYMDGQISRILDRLRETGQYDNTLIIVLADHGQGLGQHGWMKHRILYREVIRIPLIIRFPGLESGRVVEEVVRNTDVFPTILDFLELDVPNPIDGSSLRALMNGEVEQERRLGYAEALNTMDAHCPPHLPEDQLDLLFSIVDR